MSATITRVDAEPESTSLKGVIWPLAAIVIGTIMAILDATVVNVALPTLQRVFSADLSTMQWVITGYLLAQAAVIPLAGWLSDRYNARRIFLVALVLFATGSALCAAATSAPLLVAFRVLQGLGGGMLQPVGMSILYRLSPPTRRGQVMGIFGISMMIGPALGPVLSGWLVQYADWRLIFLINVPIGLVALAFGSRVIPRLPAPGSVKSLDIVGAILAPLGFASLTYGISESTTAGWGGLPTIAGIGVGLVLLALFAARELTFPAPLLDLRIFKSRTFVLAIVTQGFAQTAMFGGLFLIPLFLQGGRGYGAFATGIVTLPQAIVPALFMPIGGRIFDRYGVRIPVISGLILITLSLWQFATLTTVVRSFDLLVPMALWGAGLGMMLMPLNTYLLNAAPIDLVSRVTSLVAAVMTVISSLAIASFATIFQSHLAGYLATVGPANLPTAIAHAFDDTFAAATVIGVVALGLAVLLPARAGAPTRDREPIAVME